MSSSSSLLKKTKLSPLQEADEKWSSDKRPVKRDRLKDIQVVKDGECASTSKSKSPVKQGAASSSFGLTSIVMERLIHLEEIVFSQADEIEKNALTIASLEKRLTAHEESELANSLSEKKKLEKRCEKLQKQVEDMEKFLSDYGLIWVGDKGIGESDGDEESISFWPSETFLTRPFYMNYDLVLQKIKELNFLSGEGESFVQTTPTGAKLSKKDSIPLKLYKNGIVMFDGPFRSYEEASTQICMQDIMNGHFPFELQERFPGGLPFQVQDMRYEEYDHKLPWEIFPGEGQAVSGKKRENTSTISMGQEEKVNVNDFFRQLPKYVVRDGDVIDLRNSPITELEGSLDIQSNLEIVKDTPAQQALRDGSSSQPAITIKLRSEDGKQTYVMKMHLSETVGQLRSYLNKHRNTAASEDYNIISAFPKCKFKNDNQTLQSYGLTTNTLLLLQKKQKILLDK